jgi:hypothetical protein
MESENETSRILSTAKLLGEGARMVDSTSGPRLEATETQIDAARADMEVDLTAPEAQEAMAVRKEKLALELERLEALGKALDGDNSNLIGVADKVLEALASGEKQESDMIAGSTLEGLESYVESRFRATIAETVFNDMAARLEEPLTKDGLESWIRSAVGAGLLRGDVNGNDINAIINSKSPVGDRIKALLGESTRTDDYF